jgi:hypothetical protein
MLLIGPPGTGKTLIARQIGKMLNAKEPKIVNGPEILNKFVGQSEENIRKLFKEAEAEVTPARWRFCRGFNADDFHLCSTRQKETTVTSISLFLTKSMPFASKEGPRMTVLESEILLSTSCFPSLMVLISSTTFL